MHGGQGNLFPKHDPQKTTPSNLVIANLVNWHTTCPAYFHYQLSSNILGNKSFHKDNVQWLQFRLAFFLKFICMRLDFNRPWDACDDSFTMTEHCQVPVSERRIFIACLYVTTLLWRPIRQVTTAAATVKLRRLDGCFCIYISDNDSNCKTTALWLLFRHLYKWQQQQLQNNGVMTAVSASI